MPLDSSSDVPRGISNFIKEFSSKDERVFQKALDVLKKSHQLFQLLFSFFSALFYGFYTFGSNFYRLNYAPKNKTFNLLLILFSQINSSNDANRSNHGSQGDNLRKDNGRKHQRAERLYINVIGRMRRSQHFYCCIPSNETNHRSYHS